MCEDIKMIMRKEEMYIKFLLHKNEICKRLFTIFECVMRKGHKNFLGTIKLTKIMEMTKFYWLLNLEILFGLKLVL